MIEESNTEQEGTHDAASSGENTIPFVNAPPREPTPDPDGSVPNPKMEIRSFSFGADAKDSGDRLSKDPKK